MQIFNIPEEIIEEKNSAEIARYIADSFLNQTYGKTVLVGGKNLGFYIWDGKKYTNGMISAEEFLNDVHKFNELDKKKITIRSLRQDYLHHIEFSQVVNLEPDFKHVSFNNFMFSWEDFLKYDYSSGMNFLKQHSPDIFITNFINHDLDLEPFLFNTETSYIAEAITPNTVRIFKEWVGEKWLLLFEIIGYTLYPKYPFNKAVMLVGSGSNGKSTFLRILKEILGRENITSISLKDITSNRFSASLLFGKLANIHGDLQKYAITDTGTFKLLTGEDYISADRKFRDRIEFQNYAKLIFSANELPEVNDMTEAFWRRWIIIEFHNKFEPIDNFFEDNFDEIELSKIISISLLAFRDVLRRNKFSFEETEADYKETWLRKSDSVYAFLAEKFEQKELFKHGKIEKQKLYTMYQQFCTENDINPVEKNTFTKRLEVYGYPVVKSGGERFYKGLTDAFKTDFDDVEAQKDLRGEKMFGGGLFE